ncbi:MAG: hypothetical protein C0401_07345 [Anaerolinea sp.]|nr:hypothetical protein [Anaerolinea sp.]
MQIDQNRIPFRCPTCRGETYRTFLNKLSDVGCGLPGEWDLLECLQCGLIFTVPPLEPDQFEDYYPAQYSSYNPTGALRSTTVGGLIRRIAMLPYTWRFGSPTWGERPFGSGQLLDVGCGAGMFLMEAAKLGWHVWGIDLSSLAVEKARINAPTASIRLGQLEDLQPNEMFDMINLSHVLEHLPEPHQALRLCFEHLAPGGKLRICIPNIGSLEARLFGRAWRGLDPPRHAVHFRPKVIERLLQECGFAQVSIRPQMFASFISESIILLLPNGRQLFGSRVARLLYLAMVLPASLSYMLGNADAIELTAHKP